MANIFILAKGLGMGGALLGAPANPSFLVHRSRVNTDSVLQGRADTASVNRGRVDTEPVLRGRVRARN